MPSSAPPVHPSRFRSTSTRAPRPLFLTIATVAISTGLVIAGAAASMAATAGKSAAATSAARSGWQRFTTCDRLVTYLRNEALPYTGPYGLGNGGGPIRYATKAKTAVAVADGVAPSGGPATTAAAAAGATPVAAPVAAEAAASAVNAGADSSRTNTQEADVDEGDIVENDGRMVYSVVDGRLRIVDTVTSREIATAELPPNGGDPQLLLDGPRLAVAQSLYSGVGPETIVSLYDVSNPAAPVVLGRTHLEGQMAAFRSIDHRARIVIQTQFGQRLKFVYPTDGTDRSIQAATAENKRIVRRAPVASWLPRIYREAADGTTGAVRQALSCREVGRPSEFSGFAITWTATLDLDTAAKRIDAIGSAGVVGSGGVVYASARTLYVSTQRYSFQGGPVIVAVASARADIAPVRQVPPTTVIHAFDMSPADGSAYIASGTVNGSLLNQFSMSEFGGYLRVATTSADSGFGATTESQVRVLRRSGASLREVATLGGLGRSERIYAVRFVGDIGFVVTFRQTDPLYVVDIRDPLAPRLAGQLKIPGFSAYLQPIGDGQMLGIGQDATAEGRRLGTQISLFDVRDLANPALLATLPIGSESEAEYDHHAFLWWAPTRSVVVPTNRYPRTPTEQFHSEVVVATVGPNSLTEKGRISHGAPASRQAQQPQAQQAQQVPQVPQVPQPQAQQVPQPPGFVSEPTPIRRSLIVAGRLVTVSNAGVKQSDLSNLTELGWAPFSP